MQLEHDITEELHQWGWWAQLCPSRSLNYKSKVSLVPTKLDKSSLETLSITDDRALEIDQAIAYLYHKDKQAIKAIKLYYVCGLSYRAVGESLGISKTSANQLIDNCTSWLSGYIIGNKVS